MTALALIVAMRARPSRDSNPVNRRAQDRRRLGPPPGDKPPRIRCNRLTNKDPDMNRSSLVAQPRGGSEGGFPGAAGTGTVRSCEPARGAPWAQDNDTPTGWDRSE